MGASDKRTPTMRPRRNRRPDGSPMRLEVLAIFVIVVLTILNAVRILV
jgi:hypothetical protein